MEVLVLQRPKEWTDNQIARVVYVYRLGSDDLGLSVEVRSSDGVPHMQTKRATLTDRP